MNPPYPPDYGYDETDQDARAAHQEWLVECEIEKRVLEGEE